jgi:hypothetical protein
LALHPLDRLSHGTHGDRTEIKKRNKAERHKTPTSKGRKEKTTYFFFYYCKNDSGLADGRYRGGFAQGSEGRREKRQRDRPLFVTIEHKKRKTRNSRKFFFFFCSRRVTHQDKMTKQQKEQKSTKSWWTGCPFSTHPENSVVEKTMGTYINLLLAS